MTIVKKSNKAITVVANKEEAKKYVMATNYPQFLKETLTVEESWQWLGRARIGVHQIYTFEEI